MCETDGPASATGSVRTLDRAHESNALGVLNTGYVSPFFGSGLDLPPPSVYFKLQNAVPTSSLA